jgi:hypothetical protein
MSFSHINNLLFILIACSSKVLALQAVSSADALESTVGELKKMSFSMIFLEQIVQYPNIQEQVLAGNSDALERLKTNPNLVDVRTEIDKVLIDGSRYSLHQVITHGNQFKITLNQQLICDGKNTKSLLFGNKDSVFTDLADKSMPLKLQDIKLTSNQKPKAYDPAQLLQRYSLMGSGSSNISDYRKQLLTAKNVDGDLVFEFEDKVSNVSLSSDGLPEVITILDGEAKTKTSINIKYSKQNLPNGNEVNFPQEISSLKQILINNEYVTYIKTSRYFVAVNVLDPEKLKIYFEALNPMGFEKQDIVALSNVLEKLGN